MNVIYEIPEARSDHEEEANTNRRLAIFERMSTEYGDDDEELDYEIIAGEIAKYTEISLAVLFGLVLLEGTLIFHADVPIALSPLLLLDLKRFLLNIFRFKNYQSYIDPNSARISSFKQIIQSLGNLAFYSMLIICYFNVQILLIFTITPLIISSLAGLLIKVTAYNKCQLFSVICMTLGNWMKILLFASIGLKLDEILKIDWITVIWPLWMILIINTIFSIVSLLLIFMSICSFYNKESSISEILSSAWLFFTTSMASITIILMSYDAYHMNFKRMCIWGILYSGFFILFTQIIKIHLIKWWRSFFVHKENISIPGSLSQSGHLPLPLSQAGYLSFPTKVIRAIKLPPKALVRMSSIYFQPAGVEKEKAHLTRSTSQDIKNSINLDNIHCRSLSAMPRNQDGIVNKSNIDLAFTDRKCGICYDGQCNSVIMPCMHGGICLNCANVVMREKGACYMCRGVIEQVLKIEIEPGSIFNVVGTSTSALK